MEKEPLTGNRSFLLRGEAIAAFVKVQAHRAATSCGADWVPEGIKFYEILIHSHPKPDPYHEAKDIASANSVQKTQRTTSRTSSKLLIKNHDLKYLLGIFCTRFF